MIFSKRLQMLAGMVTPGNTAADVGCDHAFLSIYLVQRSISPRVVAMDVRSGPLKTAREHIEGCGLGTYIEARLSDGLAELRDGEAQSLICAGMGGRLMQRILRDGMRKAQAARELILQPQSEIGEFRSFLRGAGFRITAEDAVYEDGKYYFAVKAVYAGGGDPAADAGGAQREIYDEYGELLIAGGHPVLRQYLAHRKEKAEQIRGKLEAAGGLRAGERLVQIGAELAGIEAALTLIGK